MQLRFFDRSTPYVSTKLRRMLGGYLSQGVYSGHALSVNTTGDGILIGPGCHLLPTLVLVVETGDVAAAITGSFPPSLSTIYTICSRHSEASEELLLGTQVTYYITESNLTSQPTDGTIIGWINYPGGGVALSSEHLISAPRLNSWDLFKTSWTRQVKLWDSSSDPVWEVSDPTKVSQTRGAYGSSNEVWTGFLATDTLQTATVHYPFRANVAPVSIKARFELPVGASCTIQLYDTANALNATKVVAGSGSLVNTELAVASGGTWTAGGAAKVKLTHSLVIGNQTKVVSVEVNSWPFSLPWY